MMEPKRIPSFGEVLGRIQKFSLPAHEAELILLSVYRQITSKNLSRLDLLIRVQDLIPSLTIEVEALCLAELRASGFPLQYLLGTQTFLDHEYQVGPGVLIPRPETEGLLLEAVNEMKIALSVPSLGFEVGLGSGILSIELLATFAGLKMVASEISPVAQGYAHKNAKQILGNQYSERLSIIQVTDPAEVLEPFSSTGLLADFLISNPPYLDEEDCLAEVEKQVLAHEPREALFPRKSEGVLHFYEEIASKAQHYLKPRGKVFLEIPHERSEAIADLFVLPKWKTRRVQDLSQRDRILCAELAN